MSTAKRDDLEESLQSTRLLILLQVSWSIKIPQGEQDPLPWLPPDIPSAKQNQKTPLIVAGTTEKNYNQCLLNEKNLN